LNELKEKHGELTGEHHAEARRHAAGTVSKMLEKQEPGMTPPQDQD